MDPKTLPFEIADGADPGDIIGYRKNGQPIYIAFGGATPNDVDDWVPEEWGGDVIMRVEQESAVESISRGGGRREPMGTTVKHTPRSSGMGMDILAKGDTYTEDESVNDEVILTARKFGRAISFTEEDLADTSKVVDVIATKQKDWATTYGKTFDNATLATTGAESVAGNIPFTSVWKALSTTNAATDYTAGDNIDTITNAALAGSGGYDALSTALGLYEDSDYFSESDTVVVAHPRFRKALRGVKDLDGKPIFVQGQQGDKGTPDTLFGFPIRWSLGARTSATATPTPDGNPLMVIGNRQHLIVGDRSGPETASSDAPGFFTDTSAMKMRARRGFSVGHEKAFSILEITA